MTKPSVAIIMGSDSDLPVMQEAANILDKFGVIYETLILSAHRTPDDTIKYAKGLINKGIRVIIAGAGGAAHLPGVVAALFPLPVIGVPIKTSSLQGMDSLYAIVSMPPGVPVATVGINAAQNAGLLAIEILATQNHSLLKLLLSFRNELVKKGRQKNANLQKLGIKQYLKKLEK